jgi:hypothetical protein
MFKHIDVIRQSILNIQFDYISFNYERIHEYVPLALQIRARR